jgi:hypothetical protein
LGAASLVFFQGNETMPDAFASIAIDIQVKGVTIVASVGPATAVLNASSGYGYGVLEAMGRTVEGVTMTTTTTFSFELNALVVEQPAQMPLALCFACLFLSNRNKSALTKIKYPFKTPP